MLIGVVSDTHGTVPEAVLVAFEGVDRIIHAGDLGRSDVLHILGSIAPVIGVRGNVDADEVAATLPGLANVKLEGVRVLVVHRPADVPRPLPDDVRVVVTGHTHVPVVHEGGDGVLYVNPGSPTRARSGSGHSVALLQIADGRASARIVPLP